MKDGRKFFWIWFGLCVAGAGASVVGAILSGGALLAWAALAFFLLFGGAAVVWYRRRKEQAENERNYAAYEAFRRKQSEMASVLSGRGYKKKKSLMTDCEKEYFASILRVLPPRYICLPQVPLAAIVEKTEGGRQSELNRVLDFCIFDSGYRPVLAIEINDRSHEAQKRRERDQKVLSVCRAAGLPLVTAWTIYGVNDSFFAEKFARYL